jgi:glutamate formiminotransferase
MPRQLVECVPNFSEGRDRAKLDAIASAVQGVPGVVLLDRESDGDHSRSVLTFAGPPEAVLQAALAAAAKAVEVIDLTRHQGAHPRIGAVDVVPFVPIEGVTIEDCVRLAERFGAGLWSRLKVPVYLYEAAARRPERTNLEAIRRGQFEALVREMGTEESRAPDIGEAVCHPTAGATVTGARKFLIAYNINLDTADVEVARKIAKTIRFSSGGFPCVKALGLPLASRNLAQVSMNLTDFERTPMHVVFEAVRREAERYGAGIAGSEIIGLVPRKAIEMAAGHFLGIENLHAGMVLENRLDDALSKRGGMTEVLAGVADGSVPLLKVALLSAAMAGALCGRLAHEAESPRQEFDDARRVFLEAAESSSATPSELLELWQRAGVMTRGITALREIQSLAGERGMALTLAAAAHSGLTGHLMRAIESIPDESTRQAMKARLEAFE